MLKIILNRELKQDSLGVETREIRGAYVSTNDELLDYTPTNNHFINAVLLAYNKHRGLRLSPDDMLLIVNMAVSNCVNAYAETVRETFVDHSEKKNLVVKKDAPPGTRDWNDLINQMTKMIQKSLKVDFPLLPEFSTTTQTSATTSALVVMSTFKEYFGYGFMYCCGIPYVELTGTQQDWQLLVDKYNQFKGLMDKHRHRQMDSWFSSMDIILGMFLRMRTLASEGEVDAPEDIVDMWSRVVIFVPYGSGGHQYLSGWSQILFPQFGHKTIRIPDDCNLLNLDSKPPNKRDLTRYAWQEKMKKWVQIYRDNESVPASVSECPVELNDHGNVFKVVFRSGFVGVKEDDGVVVPELGWWATEQRMKTSEITVEVEKKVCETNPTTAVNVAQREAENKSETLYDVIIYISGSGDDSNNGTSRENAVYSFTKVTELVKSYRDIGKTVDVNVC